MFYKIIANSVYKTGFNGDSSWYIKSKNLLNRHYVTPSLNKTNAKHHPFINNEWKDSVYSYNKNNIVNSPFNNEAADRVIKSHFNLVYTPNVLIRSKRMRDLIRKSSTRKIFASKPDIKQTNDKAIITVFTFDRENFYLRKKLFFLARFFKNSNRFKLENDNVFTFNKNGSSFIKNVFKVKKKIENVSKNSNTKNPKYMEVTNRKGLDSALKK